MKVTELMELQIGRFSLWEKIWSYFMSRRLEESQVPYYLELLYSKNRLILNSQNANQSNDSLKKAFHYAFHRLGVYENSYPRVLLLGLGLGSVVDLLQKHCRINKIIAYENDERVIDWLQKYYFIKPEIIELKAKSAQEVDQEKEGFDLIIIDLFLDEIIPEFLLDIQYWQVLISKLKPSGRIVWNTLNNDFNIPSEIVALFDSDISLMQNKFYTLNGEKF